jgi:hypothetical protein
MVRRKLMGLLVCSLVLGMASLSWAGVPDLDMSNVATAAGSQVSVFSTPQGLGDSLDDCMAYPGILHVDATVTLTLLDQFGSPIFGYPYTDMWIESSSKSISVCAGGSTADRDTDINGVTVFTQPMFAGGSGAGLIIMINGQGLNRPPLDFKFNSPDISGDRVVNISDFSVFTADYNGTYNYRSDYSWDGILNLSDLVRFSAAWLEECP